MARADVLPGAIEGARRRGVITHLTTPDGTRVVAIVPESVLEDLEALRETLEILSDPAARAAIAEADEAIARGDVIHGVEAVRALRPRR